MKISAIYTGNLLHPNLIQLSQGNSLYFTPLDLGTACIQNSTYTLQVSGYITHADQLGQASDHAQSLKTISSINKSIEFAMDH